MSTTPSSASLGFGENSPDKIGPYKVLGVLGRGGMGVVYDAVAPHGERVALKVIRPQGDPEHQSLLIARFMREAKILEQLNHPGVVRLIDAGEVDSILYLAMERIEGVSLLTIRRQGPLGYDPLVSLGVKLSDTLAHMHEAGVVHRDIKPANILIDSAGHPIITDFGISGLNDATGITRLGDLLGSPGFMAPEVTEGAPPSALSDQFALGRLLYELGAAGAAKRLPKNAPILEILSASLEIDWNRFPKDSKWGALEGTLRRMLATRPEDRFPSARAVKSAFQALSGTDLLDTDTLSEHLGHLGLKPTKSWESEVQAFDESEILAHNQKEIDEVLKDLELPPVESSGNLLFLEKTTVDNKPPTRERSAESATPSVEIIPSEQQPTTKNPPADPDATMLPPFPAPLVTDRPEEPTIPPEVPSPVRHEPPVPRSHPTPAHLAKPQPSTTDLDQPPSAMKLYDIAKKRDRADPEETVKDPPRGFQTPMPQVADLPEGQVAKLERQILRLKEQLERARQENAGKRVEAGRSYASWFAVALLSAAAGVGGTLILHHEHPRPASIVLVAPAKSVARPVANYRGGGIPSAKDVSDAFGMYESALEHIDKKDLEGAEGLLKQCISVADLPECHKTLASMLALTHNPAARAHFEQYLRVSPTAPDAEAIRTLLETK